MCLHGFLHKTDRYLSCFTCPLGVLGKGTHPSSDINHPVTAKPRQVSYGVICGAELNTEQMLRRTGIMRPTDFSPGMWGSWPVPHVAADSRNVNRRFPDGVQSQQVVTLSPFNSLSLSDTHTHMHSQLHMHHESWRHVYRLFFLVWLGFLKAMCLEVTYYVLRVVRKR